MKRLVSIMSFWFLGLLLSAVPTWCTTITFDDLNPPHNGSTFVANGYQGLDWDNFGVVNGCDRFPASGYCAGTVSAPNVAFNGLEFPASFSSSSTFTFNSAYIAAAWNDGLTVIVQGYLNGVLADTMTIFPSATAATLYSFNWTDINKVRFASSGGTIHQGYSGFGAQFSMDNLSYTFTSQTPEPGTLSLLAMGLLGVVSRRRRKACETVTR